MTDAESSGLKPIREKRSGFLRVASDCGSLCLGSLPAGCVGLRFVYVPRQATGHFTFYISRFPFLNFNVRRILPQSCRGGKSAKNRHHSLEMVRYTVAALLAQTSLGSAWACAWSPRMGHAASKACTWASGRKLERLESIAEVLLRSEHQAKVDLIMEVSEKPTYPITIGPN